MCLGDRAAHRVIADEMRAIASGICRSPLSACAVSISPLSPRPDLARQLFGLPSLDRGSGGVSTLHQRSKKIWVGLLPPP
jgi:hypothetical protein